MKSTIKIATFFIAIIVIASLLGWVLAINNLKAWTDQYIAISMLKAEVKPKAIAVIRTKGKEITPKAISITIKKSQPDYAKMTLRELKALCKGTGIKNWARLTKPALVEALHEV